MSLLFGGKRKFNEEKIFMMLKTKIKPIPKPFRPYMNNQNYQAYIGGEDFDFHRPRDKHFIAVSDVQRCSGTVRGAYTRRNVRTVTVIPIHKIEQKRSQH